MAIEPIDRDDDDRKGSPRRAVGQPARRRSREVIELAPHQLSLPGPPDNREDDEDELSLRELWHVLFKHRWLVLGCAAFITVIALVSTLLETPLYRSTATVQIVSTPLRILPTEGVESLGAYDYDFMGTQIELLKSRAVAERAVRQLGLVGDDAFQATLKNSGGLANIVALLRGKPEENDKPATLEQREASAVGTVVGNREVRVVTGSNIVEIAYVSPDPAVAARVANGLAAAFRDADISRREENSLFARNFLQDQLQQLKLKLEDSERAVIQFAQDQKLASIDQNTSLASTNLAQLNTVLGQATAERIRAESRWQQVQAAGAASLDTADNKVLDQLRERRADLKSQYDAMRSTFKPDYPPLQQLERQINGIEARIAEETKAYGDEIKSEYESALANETLLKGSVDKLQAELLDLQGRSVQYNILKREADTNRQLYDGLLQRFKEIGVAGSANTGNVAMVDAALPGGLFKPNVRRSGLIGLLLGLLAGVALAFMVERLDDTLKSTEDIERHLRLPVVGVVPKVDPEVLDAIAEDPRSSFSEAYRSLRTGLQYSTGAGAPRTLLITSTLQGEGKTTTALMLARKFSQLGLRVLLIDGDLRKPSLHKRLNLDNSIGLSEYLVGQVDGPALFKPSGLGGLTVITSGAPPSNPAELLSAARFRSLLTVAAHSYDQIIIDAPPLLGLADAPIIATAVDGTMLVIEAGRGRIGAVRDGLKRLFAVRAQIIGTVLVKYDAKAARFSYGYGYGTSDYYYYQQPDPADGGRRRRLSKA